jgi:hypothetical protein
MRRLGEQGDGGIGRRKLREGTGWILRRLGSHELGGRMGGLDGCI